MTAPAPAQPQDRTTQAAAAAAAAQQQPETLAEEAALLALLALFLADAGTVGAAVGAVTPAALIAAMVRAGINRRAARLSIELVITVGRRTPPVPSGPGTIAQRRVGRDEPRWRAAYVLNAARRLSRSLTGPMSPAGPGPSPTAPSSPDQAPGVAEGLRRALERERRYLAQHVAAGRNRRDAARRADQTAAAGRTTLLRWATERDDRVDAECAALDGVVFRLDEPPGGIYPGAMHPTCRCRGVAVPRRRLTLLQGGTR